MSFEKVDKTVIKETLYISVWVLILSAVTQAVFLIIGKWSLSVLFGNLLSGVTGILNFFLMGLTVQAAVIKDEKKAALSMKVSQILRMLLIFAVAAVGVLLDCFNTVTVILPLFFPRMAISFRPLFNKKKNS